VKSVEFQKLWWRLWQLSDIRYLKKIKWDPHIIFSASLSGYILGKKESICEVVGTIVTKRTSLEEEDYKKIMGPSPAEYLDFIIFEEWSLGFGDWAPLWFVALLNRYLLLGEIPGSVILIVAQHIVQVGFSALFLFEGTQNWYCEDIWVVRSN
jgi:hypothetical protein